ncbi:outer membrane autotransporter protein [Sporomusa sp. KB1]|nr:outer membrane autotransporter protein [Sporomusa sp. KB1]
MQKKILRRKILLALCLGSMFTIQPAYAAEVGYSVPGDNVTLNTSEISITKTATDYINVIGVSNREYSNFILGNPLTTITAEAKSTSWYADAYGIYNYGIGATTSVSGSAAITATATSGSDTSFNASTNAHAYGIYNYGTNATTNVSKDAAIIVKATGGSSDTTGFFATADADVYGIYNYGTDATTRISGDADIQVEATGGSATSNSSATANAYAYGIDNSGDAAITTISGDAAITATATGGSAASTYAYAAAYAYGIYNSGTGIVSLEKNATIRATATANSEDTYAYSLYATGGTININQADGNPYTIKLTGDVVATGGLINLNLNNSSSFLQGNVVTSGSGTVNLTLTNNAVWQPVYDNRNGIITYNSSLYSTTLNTINALNLAGGIVNLTWDNANRTSSYRNLAITTLNGMGGTFTMNTDVANNTGDIITIGTLSSASNLKVAVNYDSSLAAITQPTTLYSSSYTPISVITGGSNLTVTGVTTDSGAYSLTPNFSGTTLTSLAIGASSNTKAAASSASGQAELMQTSVNHLRKRLGDLRNAPGKEDGIWARVYSGDVTNNKYTPVESDYKGMQMGYDKSRQTSDGRIYTGGALSYTKADNSFYHGSGDSEVSDVALYQTWLGKDGHYYDIIAKHGWLSSNYHVTDLSNNYSTADYSTGTDSLSVEYGYKKQLTNGWYLEPQTELTFGHFNSVNYTTSSGLKVKQDSLTRLIGRIGFGAGKKLNNVTQLYTSLSVLHEFKGEQNIKADNLNYNQYLSGTWYEFILGATAKLSDHSNGYINVEKLFGGDISSNWQLNAGCRWSF